MSDQVQAMFAEIAPRYDRANLLLSFGIDRRWRTKAVRLARVQEGDKVLDLACGTGDLSFAFQRRTRESVTGADFCEPMLDVARRKAKRRKSPATFQWADAMRLPFADRSFDVVSIGFGIRNVDDPVVALGEMRRVAKSGGRVVVLEFGQPEGLWGKAYRLYARHVMPRVGALVTGRRAPYEYLPRTAAAFPAGERFLDLMRKAGGFASVTATPLTGGVAFVYVGTVA